jgi:ABC-2 type transport system ATP-binding protein
MDKTILKVDKVRKYFGDNKVLDCLTIDIKQGEIFGVIGSSGSGKTTFLHTLIGFLQPDSGSVFFSANDGTYKEALASDREVKKRFGFAAQMPSFYEKLTVMENLDYFGALYGLSKDARRNNAHTLLELVDLQHAKDMLSKNLSGGMQRRLDIACSLIHNPDILILDEPTSDLDIVLAKQIWQLIKKISKKGTTIIVASHDLPEVEWACTRIGILSSGKLKHIGTFDQIKNTIISGQEIHVDTYPGNYDEIIKIFKDPLVLGAENRGNSLVIHTKRPEKVLSKLLVILPKVEESLLDIKISKLSLRDVFTRIKNEEYHKKEH